MGRYITQTDVEEFWGSENISSVQGWAALDADDTAEEITARVNRAIAAEEDYFDALLRNGKYVIPLSGSAATSQFIKNIIAAFTGFVLYGHRALSDTTETSRVQALYEEYRKRLDEISRDIVILQATEVFANEQPGGPVGIG